MAHVSWSVGARAALLLLRLYLLETDAQPAFLQARVLRRMEAQELGEEGAASAARSVPMSADVAGGE